MPTCFFWAVVFGYFYFKKKYNEKFYASKKYARAKADEDARIAALQKEHDDKLAAELTKPDEQYQKEKEHYDTVTIPEYEKARAAWTAAHDKKIEVLQSELEANEEALESLYAETKLISSYRELWILQWLYEDMSTSIVGGIQRHNISKNTSELLNREKK